MAVAGIKYDDGTPSIYAINCFPVKNLLRQGEEGTGAWKVEYRAQELKRFNACLIPKLSDSRLIPPQPENDVENLVEYEDGHLLDGFYLLKHCCVDDPSDVCSLNVSNANLAFAAEQDFDLFDNVAHINAGENHLPLEAYRTFPDLKELEIPCCGITEFSIDLSDFEHLVTLDLSYNQVKPESLTTLGKMRKLKHLHLTSNELSYLPENMAAPFNTDNYRGRVLPFPSLEVLLLDDNQLSSPDTFTRLAGLRRLQHLNLEKNKLNWVPHLKVIEGVIQAVTTVPSQDTSHEPIPPYSSQEITPKPMSRMFSDEIMTVHASNEQDPTNGHMLDSSMNRGLSDQQIVPLSNEVSPPDVLKLSSSTNGKVVRIADESNLSLKSSEIKEQKALSEEKTQNDIVSKDNIDGDENEIDSVSVHNFQADEMFDTNFNAVSNMQEMLDTVERLSADLTPITPRTKLKDSFVDDIPPPFSELRFINLAHNEFEREEALLAVAVWPSLADLDIHDNPFINKHSGDPPLLTQFLHKRLGINVFRTAPSHPTKQPMKMVQQKARKVSSYVPLIIRPSLEERMMLEFPTSLHNKDTQNSEHLIANVQSFAPLPAIKSASFKSPKSPMKFDSFSYSTSEVSFPTDEQKNKQNNALEGEAFFVTQDENDEHSISERESRNESPESDREDDETFEGHRYDELLNVVDDIDDWEAELPKDLPGSIRALRHTLGHQLVYPDTRVKPDKMSKSHVSVRQPAIAYTQQDSKEQKIHELLKDLKSKSAYTDVSMAELIKQRKGNQTPFREAISLLRTIEERYHYKRKESSQSLKNAKNIMGDSIRRVARENKPS